MPNHKRTRTLNFPLATCGRHTTHRPRGHLPGQPTEVSSRDDGQQNRAKFNNLPVPYVRPAAINQIALGRSFTTPCHSTALELPSPPPHIKTQSALSRVPPPPDPHRPRGADGLSSMPVSTHARSNNSATATAVAAAAGNHFDYFNLPQLPCSTAIIPAGIIRFEILLDTMGHKLKVIRECARCLFRIINS